MKQIYCLFLLLTIFAINCQADTVQWVSKANMEIARSDHSATTYGETIIIAGGCLLQICPINSSSCSCVNITDSVESYNPVSNMWSKLPSLPIPRYRHSAILVNDIIYLIGGRDINDNIITTVDSYDGTSWTTQDWMRWDNATSDLVAINIGTTIYAISGYDAFYDSLGQVCTINTLYSNSAYWNCNKTATLNEGRGDACGIVYQNQIFVFGGFSDYNWCAALDTLEVYDLTSNTWTTSNQRLHQAKADSACAFLHNELHAIGGEQKSNVTDCTKFDIPIKDVERFDVINKTWVEETPLPDSRFRFASAVYQNTMYLFGGQGLVDQSTFIQPVLSTSLAYTDTIEVFASINDAPSRVSILYLAIIVIIEILIGF